MFASYQYNLWEQMFDIRKYIKSTLRLISSLQGHQQNLSFGTNPICSVELYYPLDNIDDDHTCDECDEFWISNVLNVCHKLVSMWTMKDSCTLQSRVDLVTFLMNCAGSDLCHFLSIKHRSMSFQLIHPFIAFRDTALELRHFLLFLLWAIRLDMLDLQ